MKLKIRFIFVIIAIFFIDITVYAYTAYKVGDEITYNGINYYVIKDSNSKDDSVTMLKSEPLTVAEVNEYGAGHVNRYSKSLQGTAYDLNGYGGMQYYSSSTCGYNGSSWVYDGCTTDYAQSEIKYVVDAWKTAQAPAATEARLIGSNDLPELGYELQPKNDTDSSLVYRTTENLPSWVYNSNYWYWTPSQYTDSSSDVWYVSGNGVLGRYFVYNYDGVVRPVITLKKTILGDEEKSIEEDNEDEGVIDNNPDEVLPDNKNSVDKKETTTKVKVENTYMSQTLIVMIIGFISICGGVVIYYLIRNKRVNNN